MDSVLGGISLWGACPLSFKVMVLSTQAAEHLLQMCSRRVFVLC